MHMQIDAESGYMHIVYVYELCLRLSTLFTFDHFCQNLKECPSCEIASHLSAGVLRCNVLYVYVDVYLCKTVSYVGPRQVKYRKVFK